ncbi:MAG: acyl carrier protein [Oscillospiraceae bacterium]|nr:acyl carrier protein [Oscillospiraceae bacterium]
MFEKIQQNVIEAVANQLEMDPADITSETSLTEELKLDSLDFVEVCIALEDIYGVEFDTEELSKSMSASTTVNDVVEYLISLGVN